LDNNNNNQRLIPHYGTMNRLPFDTGNLSLKNYIKNRGTQILQKKKAFQISRRLTGDVNTFYPENPQTLDVLYKN
jgi:hypothetical protein